MGASRREFVMAAAAAASADTEIPRRVLGKTGLSVSILGLGGARIGMLDDGKTAQEVVRRCYDLGVNYFDCASAGAYGLSQIRYGAALKDVRGKIVLGTKTRHRTATQAQLDLDMSLGHLKTDYIDLYQVHNVINDEDIEFIFARNGVMEMIERARKAGKIRFIGVTGHTTPAVLNRIISMYDFATVLMPLSAADGGNAQKSFEKETLPLALKKDMGVIAMKTLGAGAILRSKAATAGECLRYTWSLPVSTAILGCDQVSMAEADAALARTARPLTAREMDQLRRRAAGFEMAGIEPWKVGPGDDAAGSQPYRGD